MSWLAPLTEWLQAHQTVLTWLGAISVFTFFASLLALPWLVARIPEDYFSHQRRQPTPWKESHPFVRALLLVSKNLVGAVLLFGGILMLFLPGQGILTMAMGLLLLDYPGKFRLERKIVSRPVIHNSLNWLRAKNGKPPLQID